jgi:hypothetical protein
MNRSFVFLSAGFTFHSELTILACAAIQSKAKKIKGFGFVFSSPFAIMSSKPSKFNNLALFRGYVQIECA